MVSSSREEQEPKVVIGWSSTLKKTVYDVRELSALRKPASPGGTGYVYFNPTTNKYERPRSIDFFSPPPPSKKKEKLQQRLPMSLRHLPILVSDTIR